MDVDERRPTGKEQSGQRRPSTVDVNQIKNVFLNSEKMIFFSIFWVLNGGELESVYFDRSWSMLVSSINSLLNLFTS